MALLLRPIPALVPVGLGSVGVLLAIAGVVRLPLADPLRWILAAACALLGVVAAVRLTRAANARRAGRTLAPRPREHDARPPVGHPYRGGLRRAGRTLAPPISGLMAGAVVGGALALTAAIAPVALHLAPWLELAVVLAGWWLVLASTLAVLLFRGFRLARDH